MFCVSGTTGRVIHATVAWPQQLEVNETNNTTERVIGWGIKERYRTMRGYKQDESVKNVAHLTTWLREELGGQDMTPLFAS